MGRDSTWGRKTQPDLHEIEAGWRGCEEGSAGLGTCLAEAGRRARQRWRFQCGSRRPLAASGAARAPGTMLQPRGQAGRLGFRQLLGVRPCPARHKPDRPRALRSCARGSEGPGRLQGRALELGAWEAREPPSRPWAQVLASL